MSREACEVCGKPLGSTTGRCHTCRQEDTATTDEQPTLSAPFTPGPGGSDLSDGMEIDFRETLRDATSELRDDTPEDTEERFSGLFGLDGFDQDRHAILFNLYLPGEDTDIGGYHVSMFRQTDGDDAGSELVDEADCFPEVDNEVSASFDTLTLVHPIENDLSPTRFRDALVDTLSGIAASGQPSLYFLNPSVMIRLYDSGERERGRELGQEVRP